jgi:tRNA(Ser,Leu) C12 N-acetylase TAN1
MDRSNSNSEQSNLFVISSESSRSDNKKLKRESYVKFASKVKELLDVEDNDLDQLYHKVENIVRKYFEDHKIV